MGDGLAILAVAFFNVWNANRTCGAGVRDVLKTTIATMEKLKEVWNASFAIPLATMSICFWKLCLAFIVASSCGHAARCCAIAARFFVRLAIKT